MNTTATETTTSCYACEWDLRSHQHTCQATPADPSATTEAETVAWLQRDGGWGPWVQVTVANTPEADAAAAAFFRRTSTLATGHAACVDEEASTALGPAMSEVFFPTCEHGLSAHLCAGPGHYPTDM